MTEGAVDSVAYYNLNADRFAADTGEVDMSALYERFLRRVGPGGRVLDAGCGVGRDARAFVERGYTVVAFDASAAMVRLARERTAGRAEVLQMRFNDVSWRDEFAGVWACASLLHVPASEVPPVLRRLGATLRPGGVIYMSFKHGSGERVVGGRCFTDHTEETLDAALSGTGLALADVWVTDDVRAGRTGERWLNAIVIPLGDAPSVPS
jgi:SAM-dependent methyltransferase